MADCKKKKIQTLQLFSLGPLRSRENEITLHNVQKFCKLTKPRKMSFFFSLLIIAADFFVFFACDDISFPRGFINTFSEWASFWWMDFFLAYLFTQSSDLCFCQLIALVQLFNPLIQIFCCCFILHCSWSRGKSLVNLCRFNFDGFY